VYPHAIKIYILSCSDQDEIQLEQPSAVVNENNRLRTPAMAGKPGAQPTHNVLLNAGMGRVSLA